MRTLRFAVVLPLLLILANGCCWGPRWCGGPSGGIPDYNACVDCDPFYGTPHVPAYGKRTSREVRQWYRDINGPRTRRQARRGGHVGGPGGFGGGMLCDSCGAGYAGDVWMDDYGSGFDGCCDPCGTACGMPIGYGADMFYDDGMTYGDYGGFGDVYGGYPMTSGCLDCQNSSQSMGQWSSGMQAIPETQYVPNHYAPSQPVPTPSQSRPAPAPAAQPGPMPAPGEPGNPIEQMGYLAPPAY